MNCGWRAMRAQSVCGARVCNEAPQESRGRRAQERERFERPCEGADGTAWDVSQRRIRHGFPGRITRRKRRADSLTADRGLVLKRRTGLAALCWLASVSRIMILQVTEAVHMAVWSGAEQTHFGQDLTNGIKDALICGAELQANEQASTTQALTYQHPCVRWHKPA